ncbi:MAG TPA: SDR family oxidoreductase [Deltaproteobacteria bacterium]|nr:SDR family oxidoreductase [Deltaproteobacteria bacterium]
MDTLWYGLEDKVAVVTGGSRGIGLEIARELLRQKARVAICGRKQDSLDSAGHELAGGDNLMTMAAHIAREEDVDHLFTAVMERWGTVDVLINNVGMNVMTPAIADMDYPLWQKIMDTNLNGTFLTSRRAAKIMREQAKGKIVSVSSIAGRKASPAMGIYGIAKAGIEMLTRVLSAELAPHNIQVNAVAPCMVRTEFSKPFWSNKDLYDMITKTIPLGRIAEPIDVVHPVLFLSSDAANFITGQTILVDGGATAI